MTLLLMLACLALWLMHRLALTGADMSSLTQCAITFTEVKSLNSLFCILVNFFTVASESLATRLLLLEFAPLILICNVIMSFMGSDSQSKLILKYPWFFGALYQLIGAGVLIPFYFYAAVASTRDKPGDKVVFRTRCQSVEKMRAVLPANLIGYILPTIASIVPASKTSHAYALAIWQMFPLYVGALEAILSRCAFSSPIDPVGDVEKHRTRGMIQGHLRSTMDVVVTISAASHWYCCYQIYTSRSLAASSMLPNWKQGTLSQAVYNFLFFDFLCVLAATCLLLRYTGSMARRDWWALATRCLTLGPAAGLSRAWTEHVFAC